MYNLFNKNLYFDIDYFLNILIYIPLGVYLMYFIKNKKKVFLIIVISSLLFELEQFITAIGGFDGTDLFMNTLGGLLGILIFQYLIKLKEKTIDIINLIFFGILIPIDIFAIINTIIHFNLYLL